MTDEVVVGSGNTTHDVAIPIQDNCTAPGYQFNFTPALTENFNAGTRHPAGRSPTRSETARSGRSTTRAIEET